MSYRYVLESEHMKSFFDFIQLPNFDIASDAAATFKVGYSIANSLHITFFFFSFFQLFGLSIILLRYMCSVVDQWLIGLLTLHFDWSQKVNTQLVLNIAFPHLALCLKKLWVFGFDWKNVFDLMPQSIFSCYYDLRMCYRW